MNCRLCETLRPEPEVCGHPAPPPDEEYWGEDPNRWDVACWHSFDCAGICGKCDAQRPPMGDVDAVLACLLGGELS